MTADNPARAAEGLTDRALPEDPVDRRRDLRARCDAIFREHNDALVRAVYSRLHSWEEATEVVQEAYVRVFRLDNPPPINFLRAYLYKTAFNLAYDRRGERTIRQQREDFVYTEVYSERERENPTPERLCLDEEVRTCLQVAVNKLPPKCRMAFTLVELECLGACGTAPVALVNDVLHEELTVEKLDKIIGELPPDPTEYKDPQVTWEDAH